MVVGSLVLEGEGVGSSRRVGLIVVGFLLGFAVVGRRDGDGVGWAVGFLV